MLHGDYVEQWTCLFFLKMADERTKAPYSQKSPVPENYSWPRALTPALSRREREYFNDGDELFDHYRHTFEALGTNIHFTLKTDPLKREDLDEFVKCYNPENRHNRKPTWNEKLDSGSGAGRLAPDVGLDPADQLLDAHAVARGTGGLLLAA